MSHHRLHVPGRRQGRREGRPDPAYRISPDPAYRTWRGGRHARHASAVPAGPAAADLCGIVSKVCILHHPLSLAGSGGHHHHLQGASRRRGGRRRRGSGASPDVRGARNARHLFLGGHQRLICVVCAVCTRWRARSCRQT